MRLAIVVASCLFGLAASQSEDPCHPSPCGPNTFCETSTRTYAAVCRCNPGFGVPPGGNTIDGCARRLASTNTAPGPARRPAPPPPPRRPHVHVLNDRLSDRHVGVHRNRVTPSDHLGDPCAEDPCGENTSCTSRLNRAICSCLPNHIGDPNHICRPDGCLSNPCGRGAECVSEGTRYECRCPPGLGGDARISCEENPCLAARSPCARNAKCEANGRQALCTCPSGYDGDPFVECRVNPCLLNPCGTNARCNANTRSGTAQCVCNHGYTGDPHTRCHLDPCHDNPCGPNSRCEVQGHSARCTCDPGHVRLHSHDPFSGCVHEPCSDNTCGVGAICEARGRQAICSCPAGFTGEPYTRCVPDPCSQNPCGPNALCDNVSSRSGDAAGHECHCPPGYVGNAYDQSRGCRFDPCAENPCGPNTDCQVSGDRAICSCFRGFVGSPNSRSGCRADPCSVHNSCGQGAECRNEIDTRSGDGGMRPVCHCPTRSVGNPYNRCVPGECIGNSECGPNEACQDFHCVNPCQTPGACGANARCEVRNHVAICRCPQGMTGDPFDSCRRFTRAEICAACGPNTECDVGPDDRPTCKCAPNFIGNPLVGCQHECEHSRDCGPSQKCESFRCVAACDQDACGENANCLARNNRAECTCPPDFLGDAHHRCYTECTRHDDCSNHQACVKFKCVDPCHVPETVCGQHADCNVRNHKPICSCPKGWTGDPFHHCRQFTKDDLCRPNPCGANADCTPGLDRRTGEDRGVCTCPHGYRGDPLIECVRGECEHDPDCPSNRGCYDHRCQDPCLRQACGRNADCRATGHTARCSCPSGYVGDPVSGCRLSRFGSDSRVRSHSHRFRRAAGVRLVNVE